MNVRSSGQPRRSQYSGTAEQQFDLVSFLDGQERLNHAVETSLAGFRESWKRPKWHVLIQQ